MVVGLNYRTAPMAVRERFWIDEPHRYNALLQLSRAEGIDEVIVLSTCNRTEFYLWVNDVTLAANSVMRLLSSEYGLRLQEWKHFYRLLDEPALQHIFRVVSCLDSMVVGAQQIVFQVKEAWQKAQKAGASGRFLDAVLHKALTVSKRVGSETGIGKTSVSIPSTAVELVRQIFVSLENRKVLLIGAGEMTELAARGILRYGGTSLTVVNRTFEHAASLAAKLGGTAIPYEERWSCMAEADVVISSTSCPHSILSRNEVEAVVHARKARARADGTLVIVDLAMPRDVDPAVRNIKGVCLCDLDDLESVNQHDSEELELAAAQAHKILQAEAQGFRRKLIAEPMVPTAVALRSKLDDFCRQELEAFREENGPLSKDQDEMLNRIMSRMTQRIAASLASELKELPEKVEQEQLTMALHRLFHLPKPQSALAIPRP